MMNQTSTNRYK